MLARADVPQREERPLQARRDALGQLDDRRNGADGGRLRLGALRPRTAVRARPHKRRFATRVRRDGREPPSPGPSQADGCAHARGGRRHAEAVHLHVHPSRRRFRVQPPLRLPSRAGPLARRAVPVRRDRRHRARVAALGAPRRQHRPARVDPARGHALHRHRDVQCDAGVPVEPRCLLLHGLERGRAAPDRLLPADRGDPVEAARRGGGARCRDRDGTRFPARELDRALADPELRLADHVVLRCSHGAAADRAQPLHPRVAALPVRKRAGGGGPQRAPRVRDHRLRTPRRGRPVGTLRPGAGARQRLPSPLSHDHPGADPLRPCLGARELRLPRLAAGVPGKGRRQRRTGDHCPRQGRPVRDPGRCRRRLALRALEQSLDLDPRGCARGGRARGLRRLRRHDRASLRVVHRPPGRAARRDVGDGVCARPLCRRDLPDRDPRSRLGSRRRRDEARRGDRSRDRGRLLGAARCRWRSPARGGAGRACRRAADVRRDRDAGEAARGDLGGRASTCTAANRPAARGRAPRGRQPSRPRARSRGGRSESAASSTP